MQKMEDEAEEVSDARYYIEVLENCMAEILPNLSEKGNEAKTVSDAGSCVLDDLEQVKGILGKSDAREYGGRQLIKKLLSFHESAAKLDSESNDSKCKDSIVMFVKTLRRLEKLLDKDWNAKLSDTDMALLEKEDLEDEKITAQIGDWGFIKPCSLIHQQEFWCQDCIPAVKYTDGLSFKRHQMKKHSKVVKVELIKSTCRFPHDKKQKTRAVVKHSQDQMYSHLKNCHAYEKPKDTYYRGWETYDNGVTWQPVFLKKDAADPKGPSRAQTESESTAAADKAAKNVPEEKDKAKDKVKSIEEQKHELVTQVFGPDVTPPSSQQIADNDELNLREDQQERDRILAVSVDENLSKETDIVAPEMEVTEDNQNTGSNVGLVDDKEMTGEASLAQDETVPELFQDDQKNVRVEPEAEKEKIRQEQVVISVTEEQDNIVDVDNVKRGEHTVDFDALLIEDEFYSSPKDGADPASDSSIIREPLIIEDDSDTETNDTDEQTANRINNKIKRYNNRNVDEEVVDVCDDPKNREFIQKFTKFIVSQTAAENDKVSTVSFSTGILFRYRDSFLKWSVKQDPRFNLNRLVDFLDESNYLEIRDPTPWVMDNEGFEGDMSLQASRRKEKFKLHARLREFIKRELNLTNFPTDMMGLMKQRMIRDNIDSISKDISQSRSWTKLASQVEVNRRLVNNAKQVLNPSSSSNMLSANQKYFSSEEGKKRLADFNTSYNDAMLSKTINARPFNDMGNTCRHFVLFIDRNRNSAYQFLNSEYQAKRPAWFPPGFNQTSTFDGLPKNFNMFETPSDNKPPQAWVIKVLASKHKKLKLQQDCDVVLFPQVHEMLQKYREVKEMLFGALKGDEPFFVTYRQQPFSQISNRQGSILEEYARVNNIHGLTATTLRQTLEPYVQSSHSMSTRSKNVTSHSQQVGEKFYDQSQSQFRLSSLHFVGHQEGILGGPDNAAEEGEDYETQEKRRKLDEEDNKKAKELAREVLRKTKVNRQVTLGKTCNLLPKNRTYLQELFSSSGALSHLGLHENKFPKPVKWKKIFYRVVDSSPEELSQEDWQRVKQIEHETFLHLKESIVKESGGEWKNSIEQNRHADKEVSKVIRNSFMKYEKNTTDASIRKFFKF